MRNRAFYTVVFRVVVAKENRWNPKTKLVWNILVCCAFEFDRQIITSTHFRTTYRHGIPRKAVGAALGHPAVNFVATQPGANGPLAAFAAETLLTFVLMSVILHASNRMSIARYTGVFCACLVATYISLEAPLSGMSLNPARTFGSAVAAQLWHSLWIYFTAPPLGMLLAAEAYLRRQGISNVLCAKLHHHNHQRCIFHCNFGAVTSARAVNLQPHRQPRALS